MPLKTFVKINTVNNLSDARYCAGMNVNLMGFAIHPTQEGYVSPETFQEITGWLSGVELVGELGELTADEAVPLIGQYNLQWVESNNLQTLNAIGSLKKIWRVAITSLQADIPEVNVDLILVTGPDTLSTDQLTLVKTLATKHKLILQCGVSANLVDSLLEETHAYGIAITAGDEIRPGYKDYDELADILEALEIDEWA